MEDKYDDFMKNLKTRAAAVKETMGRVAGDAAKKTGEMAELAKLNLKIFNENAELERIYREIGRLMYESHESNVIDEEKLNGLYASAEAKKEAIQILQEKADLLKSTRECPACGKKPRKDDSYCPYCGSKLD